jgi:hypothetical protein
MLERLLEAVGLPWQVSFHLEKQDSASAFQCSQESKVGFDTKANPMNTLALHYTAIHIYFTSA